MKSIIIVLVACVISVLSVRYNERYQNEDNKRIRSLFSKCFDSFNPINAPTLSSIRKDARMCIVKANSRRKHELDGLENKQFEILEEMQRFKNSMKSCTMSSNTFRHSQCISDAVEINQRKVNEISSRFDYSTGIERQIQKEKERCLQNALEHGKVISSGAFNILENCLSSVSI